MRTMALLTTLALLPALPARAGTGSALLERACRTSLPPGPMAPRLVTESVYQSEELTFDPHGGLVAKKGEALVAVPPIGPTRVISRDPALATLSLGLRRSPDGAILVTQPAVEAGMEARVLRVARDGQVSEFFTAAEMPPGLPPFIIPNGLDVDSRGSAWVSDFATSQLFRVSAGHVFTSLVVGPDAESVGGLVYDEVRSQLFYSSTAGVLRRLSVSATGAAMGAPLVVATLPGARLDGLTLDACGNLYVLESNASLGRYLLWRVTLDGAGNALGAPATLAQFDDWVSGVQFGAGNGWDVSSLFVSSIWGKVWRVPVGVGARRRP